MVRPPACAGEPHADREDRLTLGFFKRLITPDEEEALVYGCRQLGLTTAARDNLTAALRRKKGRSDDLLRALRYERALVYEDFFAGGVCRCCHPITRLWYESSAGGVPR